MPFKIEVLTAYVAVAPDGGEGVIACKMPDGNWMPLIGADQVRLKALYPKAVEICRLSRQEFRCLQFSVRTDVTEEVKQKYSNSNADY